MTIRSNKYFRKAISAVLMLMLIFTTMMPVSSYAETDDSTAASDPAADAKVYMTISDQGTIAKAADGSAMAYKAVTVTDKNSDGKLTVDEALTAAHAAYNSADGYATEESIYGLVVTKLWGKSTTNTVTYINNTLPDVGVGSAEVKDGDYLNVSINKDDTYWSDRFTYFDAKTKEITEGERFTLTLKGLLNDGESALSGISVGTWENGEFKALDGKTTDESGNVTLSFTEAGTYYVTANGTVSDQVITDYTTNATITNDCPIIAPVCVVTVKESSKPYFSNIEVWKTQSDYENGADPLTMTPEFNGKVYEGYSVAAPDYLGSLYVRSTISQKTLDTGIYYSIMYSNNWGWTGATNYGSYALRSANFPKGYISIYFSDLSSSSKDEYKINVNRYTTLKSLVIDGVMDKAFNRDTNEYHVYADSKAEGISITPTALYDSYTIKINGEEVTGGQAYTLKYDWDENGKMTADIQVSYEGYTTSTYTVNLEKMPLEDTPFIMTHPEGADYIIDKDTTALNVTASANGELEYQWYQNAEDSNEGGTAISGATEKTYAPSSEEAGTTYYYCVVTNKETGKTAASNTAKIIVDPDPTPVATIEPAGTELTDDGYEYAWGKGFSYFAGEEATPLKVTATSKAEGGEFSYKWYKTQRAYNINSYSSATGTTNTDTYVPVTTAAYANDAGYYYACKVTYKFKGKDYTSWAATGDTYTVTNSDGTETDYDVNAVYVYVKSNTPDTPTITTQPVSAQYIVDDQTTALTVGCTKSDGGTLSYQWYQNSKKSRSGATAISGATGSSYTPSSAEAGTTYYYCMITNSLQGKTAGTASGYAEIKVRTVQDALGDTLKGSGTETDPFQLASAENLQIVADYVKDGISFADICFQLTEDITLPADWAGLGALKAGTSSESSGRNIYPFSGILDGNNKTITFAKGSMPLFKYVREATVKNLNIYGEYIAEDGLVSNYVVDYGVDGNYNSGTGGSYAVGCPDTIDIINVTIKSGTTIKGSGFIGGYASGGNVVNIRNCTVESGVKIGWDAEAGASAGNSKIGSFGGDFNGTIVNCTSAAEVYGVGNVGGLVGAKGQSIGPYKVTNSSFTGKVIATGTMVGGIAGNGYTSSSAPNSPCATIENCYVAGSVTGSDRVGGIFGGEASVTQCWANGAGYIRNNHFYGTVTATDGTAGGIIGYMQSLDRYNIIENNYYLNLSGAVNGIGAVNEKAVDLTSETYGRSDDPLGADKDKLTTSMTLEQFKDKTVLDKLNSHESSLRNWVQGETYPEHSTQPVALELNVSGDYKTEYIIGEEFDMTGMMLQVKWSDGETTTLEAEDVTVSGYDKDTRGEQSVTLAYGAAAAVIKVKVLKDSANTIDVTVSVLGDAVHDSDTDKNVHTLKAGNLTEWVAEKTYNVDQNATVWDVLQQVFKENDITWSANEASGTVYIESLTRGGVTIGEFDNGVNSGWMYTINGVHSDLGVAQQYMDDGDKIVFHYTDDYTTEDYSMTPDKPESGTNDFEEQLAALKAVLKITQSQAAKLKTEVSKTTVKVSWAAVDGAEGYKVVLKKNGKVVKDLTTANASASWTNMTRGCSYTAEVTPYITYDGTVYQGSKAEAGAVSKLSKANLTVKKSGKYQKVTSFDQNSTGYQIYISKDKKFKNGVKKITVKTSEKALSKKLKTTKYFKKGKNYIKVRAYTTYNGETQYGKWSKVKTVKR